MAIGDQAGTAAVDKLDTVTIPLVKQELTAVLAPFVSFLPFLQAILDGKKRLVITLEDTK
jgi:hypothetical protein